MDVEMAYVQDSFLTNDILQEMVSSLRIRWVGAPGRGRRGLKTPSWTVVTGRTQEAECAAPGRAGVRFRSHC